MKTIILICAFLLNLPNCRAQLTQKDSTLTLKIVKPDNTAKVLTDVEKMPAFPGGNEALYKFLTNNVKYPDKAKKGGASGTVYISYIVEATGKISNTTVLKSSGNEFLDKEALRVINSMPNWIPGEEGGVKVPVQMMLPVNFTLK